MTALLIVLTAAASQAKDGTPTDETYRTVEDLRATPLTLQLDPVDPSPAFERVKDDALRARLAREPQHCVSVSGVFDLSAHPASVAESANLSLEESRRRVQIIDYQLGRQDRHPGSASGNDPAWQACDIDVLREVVNSARGLYGILGDPVPEEARDAVIVCPLPFLEEGEYGDAVLHPRLVADEEETSKAAPQLLLYRYLDFDVEPEREYRYRVRLELRSVPRDNKNPTRWTPWSEPTEWTVVGDGDAEDADDSRPG